tara:strand:+ start:49889 stop:50713 length:825 start_codon:yes stop_codon:yes gene_type:complete
MKTLAYQAFFRKSSAKFLLLLSYIISVNLLAGYCAVWLRFPSLWGSSKIFLEYAMPIGMTWALAHWPTLVLVSIPLLLMPHWNTKQITRFRIICIGLVLLLSYGVIEKIPFALFPTIDLVSAFFFSLIIAPPSYKENPVLSLFMIVLLSITALSGTYHLHDKWKHRTPIIKESVLSDGLYKLKTISVDNGYRKELLFTVELTQYIEPDKVCDTTSEMGTLLFNTYPFDKKYNKIIDVVFNPEQKEKNATPYPLGQVVQYEEKGALQIACYLKFK